MTNTKKIIEKIESNCDYLMSCQITCCNIDEYVKDIFNDYLKYQSKLSNEQLESLKESLLNAFEYTRDNNVEEDDEDTIELINEYINKLNNN